MPKSKLWPYPLAIGTHVVARVRRLDLRGDETVAGTVVRVMSPGGQHPSRSRSVSYAIRTQSGATIQALADRTKPVDTATPEGLDEWLDALEDEPDPDLLPGPDLSEGGSALQNILFNGPITGTNTTAHIHHTTTTTTSNPYWGK